MTKALRVASIGSSFRSNAVHWADQCALLKRPIRVQCPWNYTQKLCSGTASCIDASACVAEGIPLVG